jgi:hypothetical protein
MPSAQKGQSLVLAVLAAVQRGDGQRQCCLIVAAAVVALHCCVEEQLPGELGHFVKGQLAGHRIFV